MKIMNNCKYLKFKRTSIVLLFIVGILVSINSCGLNSTKTNDVKEQELVEDTTNIEPVDSEKIISEPIKKVTEKKLTKKVDEKSEEPKAVEEPKEIGMSPDAVSFLDDTETESTPKFPQGDKELKKLLKSKLRKAGRGEKATFRVSMVIKSDGSVGRVQFNDCGYNDDYKAEIISALQTLPAFTPGTKDGVAVDSWYYLTYKR